MRKSNISFIVLWLLIWSDSIGLQQQGTALPTFLHILCGLFMVANQLVYLNEQECGTTISANLEWIALQKLKCG